MVSSILNPCKLAREDFRCSVLVQRTRHQSFHTPNLSYVLSTPTWYRIARGTWCTGGGRPCPCQLPLSTPPTGVPSWRNQGAAQWPTGTREQWPRAGCICHMTWNMKYIEDICEYWCQIYMYATSDQMKQYITRKNIIFYYQEWLPFKCYTKDLLSFLFLFKLKEPKMLMRGKHQRRAVGILTSFVPSFINVTLRSLK